MLGSTMEGITEGGAKKGLPAPEEVEKGLPAPEEVERELGNRENDE